MRHQSSRRNSSGFTLIELIISIVLVGLLAVVGSSMIADSFGTSRMVNANNASTAQARYALERLVREIREVKFDSTGSQYCINTMTGNKLVFYKTSGTYDSTCATNAVATTITQSGANLTLNGAILSDQVVTSGLAFAYYQNDGVTASGTTAANVRFIQITLPLRDSASGQSISQRTRVALRNQ